MADKKIFAPKLYNAGGDLSKKWFVYWYENGQRVRKYGKINKYTTLAERNAEAETLLIACQGKVNPALNLCLHYLEKRRPLMRAKTYAGYKSKITHFFRWLKNRPLDGAHIALFFEYLIEKGINPNTINGYRRHLRTVFKRALDVELNQVEKLRANPKPATFFQRSQAVFLIKEIHHRDPQLYIAVLLQYYCFIRPREMRALVASDIILEDKKILLRAEISKNRKEQYVRIPEPLFEPLADYVGRRHPEALLFEVGENTLSARHQKLLKELGFDTKRYKFYSWKHTGAVMATRAGIGVKQLQIQLRHHSLDQVNMYLRQMGLDDLDDLATRFPKL